MRKISTLANSAKANDIDMDWSVSESDISLDLALITDDLFMAKLVNNGNELKLFFDNGQRFKISIKEI